MATSNGQAPKKTMFKRIFRFGGANKKKKSPTLHPHPTTSSHQAPVVSYEKNGCACCEKTFNIRQSFRKNKCHVCQKRVCTKCYLVNKLCHKCKIKQLPEVNNTDDLVRIDNDRLVSILGQIHCNSKLLERYKSDRNAMVRTLLTICELKSTLIEYEKNLPGNNVTLKHEKTTLKEPRISTKPSDSLPPNSIQLHSHATSMPSQNDDDIALKLINHQQELSATKEEQTAEVFQVSNGHYHHHHHQTVEQTAIGKEFLFVQSPKMSNSPHFNFLPNNVIEEEDEKEDVELPQHPEESEFPMPPPSIISNRKSEIEIFYSAEEIPQMEGKNEKIFHVEVVRENSSGYVKLMPEVHNILTEKREEQIEIAIQNEIENEITERASPLDFQTEDKFEVKLNSLNQIYRPQYKIDLSSVVRQEEIRQMTLFELKTILQKRGRPITGLISYEDFVQKVISVWEEEKSAKEAERKLREEEEKIRLEKVFLLEEEMRKMEEERQRLEEAERFKSLYEEEYGMLGNTHQKEESEDEESLGSEDKRSLSAVEEEKLSDHEADEEMEFETAEVIQAVVKTAQFLKTEVNDLEQLEFEMIENRLEIEEIEQEWKHSSIKYIEKASVSQPEMVEFEDEDSFPPPPSPPPTNA